MKKDLKVLTMAISAFLIGAAVSNFAMSVDTLTQYKVAVIDLQKVAANASQVKKIAEDRKAKLNELAAFFDKAKTEVTAEKDATKKKDLEDKYNKELNDRKTLIEKDYAASLKSYDKNITTVISKIAKEKNCNLVLYKGVVLFGGDDITNDVISAVK